MNDQTPVPTDDRIGRRIYLAFCCASVLFLVLIVLVTTVLLVG